MAAVAVAEAKVAVANAPPANAPPANAPPANAAAAANLATLRDVIIAAVKQEAPSSISSYSMSRDYRSSKAGGTKQHI
ncbi:hypothetical protein KGF56_004073 [Candida oxycetoniae]|uniref:Uncharacterized protein n=1 Tax=Candida oxycetoniae TaxID=497107 RepID=A0AAI9SUZ7_9ASCO|nr:uncharacterized protein KGF56_004073 [Candida oxycetoniae]KAI3403184.1 hypothetical protein KGF56_004073 [Candida oxycetoniae]